jgi:type IV pilus assembly protein PilW
VAVVARAQLQEREALPAENTTCRQPDGAVNTNGPCTWIQRANTVGQQAPTWNLSGANWQNFRYRVYETIIPMRNVMWQSF